MKKKDSKSTHVVPRSPLAALVAEGMRKGFDDVKRAAQDKTMGNAHTSKPK